MVLSTSTSQLPGPAASAVQSGGCGGAASRLASNMPTTTQQAVGAAAAVEPFCHDSLQADLAFLEAVLKGNAFRPPPVLDCRPSVTGFLAGQGALGALGGGAPPQPQLSATGCGPLGDLLRLGRSAPTPYLPSAGSSGPAALHSQLQASMDGSAPRGTTSPQQRQQQQQQLQQLLHSSGQGSAHLQSSPSLDLARQSSLGQKWLPETACLPGQPFPQLLRSLSQPQSALQESAQQPAPPRQQGGPQQQQHEVQPSLPQHATQQQQSSSCQVADGDEDVTEAEFSLMHFLRMYQAGLSRQPEAERRSQPVPLAEAIPSLAHLEQLAAAASAELQADLSLGSRSVALSSSRSQPLPQQYQPQPRPEPPPWDEALALLHEPPPTWQPSLSESAAGAARWEQQPLPVAGAAHAAHAQHLRKAWSLPERFHAQAQQQAQQQVGRKGAPPDGSAPAGRLHSLVHQRQLALAAAASPRLESAAALGPSLPSLAAQHSLPPPAGGMSTSNAAAPEPSASISRSTTASAASSVEAQTAASAASRQRNRAGVPQVATSRAGQQAEQQVEQQAEQQAEQAQLGNGRLGRQLSDTLQQPRAKRQRVAAAVPGSSGGMAGAAGEHRPQAAVLHRAAPGPGLTGGEQLSTPQACVHEGRAHLSAAQQQQQQYQQPWQWQLQQLQARGPPSVPSQPQAMKLSSPPLSWPASGAAVGPASATAGPWQAGPSHLESLSNPAELDSGAPAASSHQVQQHSVQSKQAQQRQQQQQAGVEQFPVPGAAALRTQRSGGGSGGGSSGSGRASARTQQPAPPQLPGGAQVLRTLFQEAGMHMARKTPQAAAAAAAATTAEVENGLICAVQLVQSPAAAQPSLRVLLYQPSSGEVVAVKEGVRPEEAELCPELVHGSAAWDSGDGWLLLFDLTHQPRRFFQALCCSLAP